MSSRKRTVDAYFDGFRASDHEAILGLLSDEVVWLIHGHGRFEGKEAFDGEIENDAFVGRPTIDVARLVEEDDVVVAEGRVRSARSDGGELNAVFCDVFILRDARIRHLTSYVMEVKE